MSDVGKGILHGFASFFGFGEFCNPLADQSAELTKAYQNMSQTLFGGITTVLQQQSELLRELYTDIQLRDKTIRATMNLTNYCTTNLIRKQGYTLNVLGILIVAILLYLLFA